MDQSAFILRTTALLLLMACVACAEQIEQSGEGTATEYNSKADGVEGRITGIRLWENPSGSISGLQFQYNGFWSPVGHPTVGHPPWPAVQMELYNGETIIRISGKWNPSHSQYINQLQFMTNMGRTLTAGQPVGPSFNYDAQPYNELLLVSGHYDDYGITSIKAHWGIYCRSECLSHAT